MSVNKQILMGHLGNDPEMSYTKSGTACCKFSIATNDGTKEYKKTNWHNCVAWGKAAEVINQYVKKGDQLYVEGNTDHQSWDGGDGQKKYKTVVNIREFSFVSNGEKKPKEDNGNSSGYQQQPNDDDIPF